LKALTSRLGALLEQIRSRKVLKVTIAYLAIAWALIEVSAVVFPALLLPEWSQRLVVILAMVALPLVIALAWFFDITPQGVIRTDSEEITPTPRPAPRLPARPLVGREREQQQLAQAFGDTAKGSGVLVGICGEAGMGKTVVAEDFIARLANGDTDCMVARGRSSERFAGAEAYVPMIEALTDLVRYSESDDFAKKLKKFAPSWHSVVFLGAGHIDEDVAPAANSQDRLYRELLLLFEHCTQDKPLVLFFEDFHWADASTVDAVIYLANRFDRLRLLLILTYRESELLHTDHPFRQARLNLHSHGLSREIKLDMFSEEDIAAYLDAEFPGHQFPQKLGERIFQRTAGHPLFVTDLVRYLKGTGGIRQQGESWVLNAPLEDIEKGLPESVRSMVERKMSSIDEDERELLTPAAVQGYAFDSAVLARVLDLEPEVVEEKLEALERVHSLVHLVQERQMPDRTLTSRYEFAHNLYLDYWFNSLRPTRKATISRMIAQVLEDFHGDRKMDIAPELAALYENAREHARASEHFLAAAGSAKSVFAHREAAELVRKGMRQLEELSPSRERDSLELKLQIALGGSLCMTKGYADPETVECFDRALALSDQLGDKSQDANVLWGLWMAYAISGNCERALELSERLSQLAQRIDEEPLRGAANYAEALTQEMSGDLPSTLSHLKTLLDMEPTGSAKERMARFVVDPFASARGVQLRLLTLMGHTDLADDEWVECRALADDDDLDPRSACDLLISGSCHLALLRKPREVLELTEHTVKMCEEHDIFLERQWAEFWRGWALAETGAMDQGLEKMRVFIDLMTAAGTFIHHALYFATLAESLINAGRGADADELVQRAMQLTERTGQKFFESELVRLRGVLASMENNHVEAQETLERAVDIAAGQEAKLLETRAAFSLAQVLRTAGDSEREKQVLSSFVAKMPADFHSPEFTQVQERLQTL